jgi:hypothetical protein
MHRNNGLFCYILWSGSYAPGAVLWAKTLEIELKTPFLSRKAAFL